MNPETITIDGIATTLAAAGFMTWTASDISLRLRPNMTWRATRVDIDAVGATAQEAADNLTATERKTEKAAKLAAASTKGQTFAREMRTHLHIGPRTRRFAKRWTEDGHRDVMQAIEQVLAVNPQDRLVGCRTRHHIRAHAKQMPALQFAIDGDNPRRTLRMVAGVVLQECNRSEYGGA